MLTEQKWKFCDQGVSIYICNSMIYFRAFDVTAALQYKQCSRAVDKHVSPKYVKTLKQLCEEAFSCIKMNVTNRHIENNASGKSPLHIKEAGVYELIFGSKMSRAIKFREWVVDEVLPEIRKTGNYVRNKQMSLMNETDLHFKVIDFIRRYWPEANRIIGLGELQDSDNKRIEAYRKGYTKGQPDLIILNRTKDFSGLVIELKTPLGCGKTSPEQETMLERLKAEGYNTVVSYDYDELLVTLIEYRDKARQYTLNKARVRRASKKNIFY